MIKSSRFLRFAGIALVSTGLVALAVASVAAVLLGPVMSHYLSVGDVPRMPTLFVGSFLLVIACMLAMVGLVIDGQRKSRHEVSRLSYMRHPAVRGSYVTDPLPQADVARADLSQAVVPA